MGGTVQKQPQGNRSHAERAVRPTTAVSRAPPPAASTRHPPPLGGEGNQAGTQLAD